MLLERVLGAREHERAVRRVGDKRAQMRGEQCERGAV
jgi:hypothetical protein